MDKIERAADLIVSINQYHDGELSDYIVLQKICAYYDSIKNDFLTSADKQFLYDIATTIGVPQYFDMLQNFRNNSELPIVSLINFSHTIYESSLYISSGIKLHRYQKDILNLFEVGEINRYFLSASTSFGKTFLVYEIIRKMNYKNILLVFPTIALLSENLEKIYSDNNYSWIKQNYAIHTITNVPSEKIGQKNIFLFTPERYLSFLDFKPDITFNFAFVDEVYKIDNDYLIDDQLKENERDVAYRISLFYAFMNPRIDTLLAGPYIEFSNKRYACYNPSFDRFLKAYNIKLLNYNNYEIVNKDYIEIKSKKEYSIENYSIQVGAISKAQKLLNILTAIITNNENAIVYCPTRTDAEKYANLIVENEAFSDIDTTEFDQFLTHLNGIFDKSRDWIVIKALKKGVGIHHGLVPKYIQKEIIQLFNAGYIKILLSTTTITEGVNTTAKNLIVTSHKKGKKELKTFDALNIAGRAGRFLSHYKGNVISLDQKYISIKDNDGDPIKHKNYDENAPKGVIDIFYTDDLYLTQKEKNLRDSVKNMQSEEEIPDEILNQFKVISPLDKIQMYQHITKLSDNEHNNIRKLINKFNACRNIDYSGIETIIGIVLPYVKHPNLRMLMTIEQKNKTNKVLTALLYAYFKHGFRGMVDFHLQRETNINKAVRDTANFIYNTLKYQVSKYFGAFNVMYKYYISLHNNKPFNDVIGIDSMLLKMEYNANTENGRLASDYGVPQKLIDYYDADNFQKANAIYLNFDQYEETLFQKVNQIINS